MISLLKKDNKYEWLKKVNSQTLQEKAIDLEKSFQRFFKIKDSKYPKFKKKGQRESFCIPQHFFVDPKNNCIKIPKLKSPIETKFHRSMKGVKKINSLTISMSPSGKCFVSINVYEEIDHKVPIKKIIKATKCTGIDLGLTDFIIDAKGNKTRNPKYLYKSEKKLKKAQRNLSKKEKRSNNREKQRLKVAKVQEKIKNQRIDFLHKISHKLAHENQVIYIEDLDVKKMMKNKYLAKSIHDVGWSEFVRQLKYKVKWTGSIIIQIGRFEPSTKLCSTKDCGYINKDIKLSDRKWICPKCKTCHDREVNAAKNIEIIGRGTPELKPVEKSANVFSIKKIQAGSMKQESLASK
jgi:putative transposase